MKLSDVMSNLGLAGYAEVGMVLFLGAFLAVVVDLLRRGREIEASKMLPFSSDEPADGEGKEGPS